MFHFIFLTRETFCSFMCSGQIDPHVSIIVLMDYEDSEKE